MNNNLFFLTNICSTLDIYLKKKSSIVKRLDMIFKLLYIVEILINLSPFFAESDETSIDRRNRLKSSWPSNYKMVYCVGIVWPGTIITTQIPTNQNALHNTVTSNITCHLSHLSPVTYVTCHPPDQITDTLLTVAACSICLWYTCPLIAYAICLLSWSVVTVFFLYLCSFVALDIYTARINVYCCTNQIGVIIS